jgi:hypothetical protein
MAFSIYPRKKQLVNQWQKRFLPFRRWCLLQLAPNAVPALPYKKILRDNQ